MQIAVDEIDDKAKECIIAAGGRVEFAATYVAPLKDAADMDRFNADVKKAMSTTLVRLPSRAECSRGYAYNTIEIVFDLPGTDIEVTLLYGIASSSMETSLTYEGDGYTEAGEVAE
jgi:hypothetical protein